MRGQLMSKGGHGDDVWSDYSREVSGQEVLYYLFCAIEVHKSMSTVEG